MMKMLEMDCVFASYEPPTAIYWVTFLGALMIAVCILCYLIPTIVAILRDCTNKAAIILINVFLGWSGVGFLAALIWSIVGEGRDMRKQRIKDEKQKELQMQQQQMMLQEQQMLLQQMLQKNKEQNNNASENVQ